jgi:hypothetical protein
MAVKVQECFAGNRSSLVTALVSDAEKSAHRGGFVSPKKQDRTVERPKRRSAFDRALGSLRSRIGRRRKIGSRRTERKMR